LLAGGMAAYGMLCAGAGRRSRAEDGAVPSGCWLSAAEVARRIPGIEQQRPTGGRLFYECHMHSSERMTLAFVDGARRAGAVVANYVGAETLLRQGNAVAGVGVRDLAAGEEFEIAGRVVINAAGPWIRRLMRRLLDGPLEDRITGFSRGTHIVTRALTDGFAVALPTRRHSQSWVSRGGRHVFIIPWRGHSLIGTSDRPYSGDLDEVGPSEEDIADLIGEINAALGAGTLRRADVLHAYSGLYPLQAKQLRDNTYQGTGAYQIVDHGHEDGIEGLYTVLGAKYTTARRLAERAIDRIVARLGATGPCTTRSEPLPAGGFKSLDRLRDLCRTAARGALSAEWVEVLVTRYGADAPRLIERVHEQPNLAAPLAPGREVLEIEVLWAVEHEMAVHLEDFVMRRTGLGTLGNPGAAVLRRSAELMGVAAGWDTARQDDELDAVTRRFAA